MYRTRLLIALAILAAAAVAQGLLAIWALSTAERQVQRGRVASDIQLGFAALSMDKQRLRGWATQLQFDAGADPRERDRILAAIRTDLERLRQLSRRAVELDDSDGTRMEHVQRQDSLEVLDRSLNDLGRALSTVTPLDPGVDLRAAWKSVGELFDLSHGRDLRSLIAGSMAREASAVLRERAAADAALSWMRNLWLGTAAALALAALLLAAYFVRALRHPLHLLSEGAQALQRGDLRHRIPVAGDNEFSEVARSFNAMAAELSEHRGRDAIARQQLEELVQARTAELQSALETLQEMDRRRRQLYADIGHELRTPTTAIRGEAEVALRGGERGTEEYKAALTRIVETSRQLGHVIDDLLTMTRSDADALPMHWRQIDLSLPLNDALAQARAVAQERQVTVSVSAWQQALPLEADAMRLRQIIMVLLDNAVRYSMPGTTVRVTSLAVVDPSGRPCCELLIEDEGIGIPPDELGKVFDRSFRGERARRHRADGSGLGLSIGQALAKAHGGDIALSIRLEGGTTARLRLPLRKGALVEARSA